MPASLPQPVLCAVDAGPRSRAAALLAGDLAGLLGRPLLLLNVMPATPPLMSLASVRHAPMDYSERLDATRDRAEALLESLASEAGVPAAARVVASGLPAEAVLECAEREDPPLIVMGTHNRGLLASAVLGSVSSSVVAAADRPVLLVPSDHRPAAAGEASIVAGLDGRPSSAASLRTASSLAARAGLPLVAAHVASSPGDARLERIRATAESAGAELAVRHGDVAEELVAVAAERGAAMVALGTKTFGRVRAAVLGSVSRAVVDRAAVPVLIVTERARDTIGGHDRQQAGDAGHLRARG